MLYRVIRYVFSLSILILLVVSCNKNLNIKDDKTLVKIGSKTLYRSDVEENIPTGLSREDSTIAAEHYIRSWANNILLYDKASKNIDDKDNIDKLMEDYRRALIINRYQEQLVNEKTTGEIVEQSLLDYYNQNKDKLKLERSLIKGVFIKVSANAPQLNEIRQLYKSTTTVSLEKLKKYSLNNVVDFDYFVDKWMDFNDIMNNFPKGQLTKDDLTVRKKTLEKEDDNFYYFLNITDCLLSGDNSPFEYAKATVREILLNQRKIDFLKKTEDDLYKRAVDKGEIQFYNE
jgi:hypothetical protein